MRIFASFCEIRQQDRPLRHSLAAGDSFRVSDMPECGQQAGFLVRIFSNYPKSGRSLFLFCFSLCSCIRAVFFFCATFRNFLRHFQITGPLPAPVLPQLAKFRRVLLPVILSPAALALVCPACVLAICAEMLGFVGVSPAASLVYPQIAGFSRFPPAADLPYLVVSLWE